MITKRVLFPDRVRTVPPSFSWLDHRLLRHGYLDLLSVEEMLLYFFLVLVGDGEGLSYYASASMARHLKLSVHSLRRARAGLCRQGLIAFESPLYQVLSLPVPFSRSCREDPGVTAEPVSLHAVLKNLKKENPHEH